MIQSKALSELSSSNSWLLYSSSEDLSPHTHGTEAVVAGQRSVCRALGFLGLAHREGYL